jgi:hypothetical protein
MIKVGRSDLSKPQAVDECRYGCRREPEPLAKLSGTEGTAITQIPQGHEIGHAQVSVLRGQRGKAVNRRASRRGGGWQYAL